MSGVLARNVEFSQLVIDYQREMCESSDSLQAAEVLSRKLSMEVSMLKHEKDLFLSQIVHRLQASSDTFHSAEEAREEARAMEKRKHEEYLKQFERECAQVMKELQEERDNVRTLVLDRKHTINEALRKQLADALLAVASAESRAAVAELSLSKVKEEMEKLKVEAQSNKDHMLQYKNIAQVNEVALKQVVSTHETLKAEIRKLVRPNLARPPKSSGDIEMTEVDGGSNDEGTRDTPLPTTTKTFGRKRLASLPGLEESQQIQQPDTTTTTSIVAPTEKNTTTINISESSSSSPTATSKTSSRTTTTASPVPRRVVTRSGVRGRGRGAGARGGRRPTYDEGKG